jgi:hypothetical protein
MLRTFIKGFGCGASFMYFYDPDRGNARRARLIDQAASLADDFQQACDVTIRDLSNRTQGLVAELFPDSDSADVTDETLVARVRSKMGRLVSHPGSIEVESRNHRVTLTGPVLASEVQRLVRGVSKVSGVAGVENRMEVHQQPGTVSGLQGEGRCSRGDWQPGNWSPTSKLLAGVGVLMMPAAIRRAIVPLTLAGVAYRALGSGPADTADRLSGPQGRGRRSVEERNQAEAGVASARRGLNEEDA